MIAWGELAVACRHGGHGTGRVVACHGHHRDGSEPRQALHLPGECADDGARVEHSAELVAVQSYALYQFRIEFPRLRVQHL